MPRQWKPPAKKFQDFDLDIEFSEFSLGTTKSENRYCKPPQKRPNKPRARNKKSPEVAPIATATADIFALPWDVRRQIWEYFVADLYPRIIIGHGRVWPRDGKTWPHFNYCRKFSYCFRRPPHGWTHNSGDPGPEPGALLVCKQLRQELLDVLVSSRPLFCENIWGYKAELLPTWYNENIEKMYMGYLRPTFDQKQVADCAPGSVSWWNDDRGQLVSFLDDMDLNMEHYDFLISKDFLRQFPRLKELRIRWVDAQLDHERPARFQWQDFPGRQHVEKEADALLRWMVGRILSCMYRGDGIRFIGERTYVVKCRYKDLDRSAAKYWGQSREHFSQIFVSTIDDGMGNLQTTATYSTRFDSLEAMGPEIQWWLPAPTIEVDSLPS